MKMRDALLQALLSSPYLYLLAHLLSALQLNPFAAWGAASLLLAVAFGYSAEVLVAAVIVPASASLALLATGYPDPLIGLAAGYLSALPLFMVLGAYRESGPDGLVAHYLMALGLSILLLQAAGGGPITPLTLVLGLIVYGPTRLLGVERPVVPEPVDQLFTALAALSTLILLLASLQRLGSAPRTGREVSALLASAAGVLGLAALTRLWLFGGLAVASSALILTVSLTLYLGLRRD